MIIVTLISKYIKTTAELIFIILLRHMVLLVEKSERCILIYSMPGTQEVIFQKTQPLVYVHSERSSGCLQLWHWMLITFRNQTKAPRKQGLMPLTSLAVVACLASCSPHSYSPCTALIPSLTFLSGAGVWLCLLRLLPVMQAAMAKEPADLCRRLH